MKTVQCEHGHTFVVLDDHPIRNDKPVCVHCAADTLDRKTKTVYEVSRCGVSGWLNRVILGYFHKRPTEQEMCRRYGDSARCAIVHLWRHSGRWYRHNVTAIDESMIQEKIAVSLTLADNLSDLLDSSAVKSNPGRIVVWCSAAALEQLQSYVNDGACVVKPESVRVMRGVKTAYRLAADKRILFAAAAENGVDLSGSWYGVDDRSQD